MKRYKFKVAEHEELGGLGFKPSWYPQGDPLGGIAVAHDILEHFPNDDGSAEGEFLALGAALYIRGSSGLFHNGSPEENISADLYTVWGVHTARDGRDSVRPCGVSHDSNLMERCREAVRLGVREFRYGNEDRAPSREAQEGIARWIARGYNRAARRYGKLHYSVGWELFKPIVEKADNALKHAEEDMELIVQVDLKRGNCSVVCDYPREYWGD